jgi:lysozyme
MTSNYLVPDLQRDEAHVGEPDLKAYPDPGTGGPPWTIGYGHTGREVHPGLIWTVAQCNVALLSDIQSVCTGLDTAIPWWRSLDDLRQDCLVNIAFNLGVHGLLEFNTFLAYMRAKLFNHAALDLMGTLWYRQVGDRAKRIHDQILTGVHQQ